MTVHNNFTTLVEEMKKKILDQVQSKETMDLVGLTAIDLIYKRVKSGKGVTSDTTELPETIQLAPLSASYKKQRDKNGVSGEFGSIGKSNLTNTGQMLEAMQHKFKGPGRITLEIQNSQRADGKTNAEIAGYVREKRPFFNLSRGEALVVSKTLTSIIDKITRLFNQ